MDQIILVVAPCPPNAYAQTISGLPSTPEEIADEVVRSWQAGAALTHLHVMDEHGQPTSDLAAFRRTISLIRQRCDIIIEGSTGGTAPVSAAERSVALQADIEMASFNPGSVNFSHVSYVNSPQDIDYWAQQMHSRRIKPDITVFDSSWIANAIPYIERGLIAQPAFFSFVLGQEGAIPATPRHVNFLIESLPPGSLWGCAGHSGHDLQAAMWAIAFGGQARAGFEDNVFYQPGQRATSNAQLIERLARITGEAGRAIASPSVARKLLGLFRT
jgi:3-keto-5-aminohexanoate cleavage enzyme